MPPPHPHPSSIYLDTRARPIYSSRPIPTPAPEVNADCSTSVVPAIIGEASKDFLCYLQRGQSAAQAQEARGHQRTFFLLWNSKARPVTTTVSPPQSPPQCHHHSHHQCHHHSVTTTVTTTVSPPQSPPQCHHHSHHHSVTTIVSAPQCHHHSVSTTVTTTVSPPQCHHHSVSTTVSTNWNKRRTHSKQPATSHGAHCFQLTMK